MFKDGGKEEKKEDSTTSSVKCYFVRMESKAFADKDQECILSGKTIQEARSIFMLVHGLPNIAKYMARILTEVMFMVKTGNLLYIQMELVLYMWIWL